MRSWLCEEASLSDLHHRAKELFLAARAMPEAQRPAWLAQACGGDTAMQEEVASLLAAAAEMSTGFLAPQGEVMTGQALGRYRIEAQIGAGGMGEVYRAHDEQLDRDVAVKVLPALAAGDEAARARLLREARAAAALNHPHICTIHEVGEVDGRIYIAMELLEGQTLDEAIPRQGLPLGRVVRYGAQIADALAHAHERGVVHRDLKAGNVIITPDGRAKVLDFGLAKRLIGEELTEAATQSLVALTQQGTVLGTPPYMAPEQLRGQAVDARSDVWALGVVLYEIAAGERPFQGQTGPDLAAAILEQSLRPLPARAPAQLRAVIERCLEKEPGQRYQRAGEVRAALEAIGSGAVSGPRRAWRARAPRATRRFLLPGIAIAVIAIAVLLGFNVRGLRGWLFSSATPRIESIAVLPFSSRSPGERDELLEYGLADTLIAQLSRSSSLRVRSLASAQRFADPERDAIAAGRQLGAAYVVEGSTQRHGDRVRVNARLLTVPDGRTLWADTFDEAIDRVFTLQDGIAGAVSAALAVKIGTTPAKARSPCEGADAKAYRALLAGFYVRGRPTAARLPNALAAFRRAIDLDPSCARAYAGLAQIYFGQVITGDRDPREMMPLARAAAEQAIAIDPDSADGYAQLGFVATWYDWNWAAAEAAFQRAIALDPSAIYAQSGYAHLLLFLRRFEAGVDHMHRAYELDPLSPMLSTLAASALGAANQPEAASRGLERALELDPDFWVTLMARGGMALDRGDAHAAIADFERAVEHSGENSHAMALLAMAYGAAGDRAEARAVLDQLEARGRSGYVPATSLAAAHLGLGETEAALDLLERANDERDVRLAWLGIDARWNELRTEPRFRALAERLGLSVEHAYGRF